MILKKARIPGLVLGAIAVAGIAAWAYQLANGLGVTGMSNGTSWGLYITCFMFFVGLSAGGLIVASSASVFHVSAYKKVALPAVILSTVCICLAGMFVLIDLGGIARVWRLLTGPNPLSPLFWDVCVISLYLAINVVYLVLMKKRGVDSVAVSRVSRVALPVAILVHSVTAWIFGLQIAREGWYSAIMAPIFVASAMDSGLALLLVSLAALEKARIVEAGRDLLASLAGLLAACIAVDAFLVGCEVLTVAYPQADGASLVLGEMLSGATAPYFWFEVIVGMLVPFCILVFAKNRRRTGLVVFSSACVIAGVFCKRVWLLFTSFVQPNLESAPGITLGTVGAQAGGADMWSLAGFYAPTWVEVVVVAGVVALGALAYLVLADKLLASGPKASDEAEAPAVEGASA